MDLGIFQKDVAALLGVTEGTICYWENKRNAPALRLIPRIIEFLQYAPWAPCQSVLERLKMQRQNLGLSRKRLAKILGVDESSLVN